VLVLDGQQTALLEVRRRDAPAALEVLVKPIAEHFAQGGPRGLATIPRLGVAGVSIERQIEGGKR
jgi:hypothetical protein